MFEENRDELRAEAKEKSWKFNKRTERLIIRKKRNLKTLKKVTLSSSKEFNWD